MLCRKEMEMEQISYSRQIPLLGQYDVAVVGGGPAGVCAAVEAARNGMKTVLLESSGMLGGMATTGLVGPFMTCFNRDGDRQIVKGLFREIVSRTQAGSGAINPEQADAPSRYTSYIEKYHNHVTPFDSFALQIVLDDLVGEAGVEVFLYTRFFDCIVKDGIIESILLAAPQGAVAIGAKQFIDCSGNADVAYSAGVPTWKGDENGTGPQPATLFFEVGNVDDSRYTVRPPKPVKAYKMPEKGKYKVNHDRVFGVDATDAASMTAAHRKARRQVEESFRTLRQQPGFENCTLLQVAPVLGVRESRHIKGKYCLTVEDICEGKRFPDSVCVFGYGMDVHSRDGKMAGGFHGESADMYEIPYRCLIPENCKNLLVAGKTICAESQAAGSLRVMPACMATGQAAGAAAFLAVRNGCKPEEIPVHKLKSLLTAHNAVVDIDDKE